MTPTVIAHIRQSFEVLAQDPPGLAAEFYDRLFTIAPSTRPLFKTDLRDQGSKLVGMLAVVVRNLDRLESIVGAVQSLGRRHADYGVRDEHYDQVGSALLETLGARLGPAFTDDVREAWASAYGVLSTVMREAQAPALRAA